MSNQNIAIFLKQLRKTSGYSVNDVIEQLKAFHIEISTKTLYGYESGLSMLNADVFVALCRIYKCDNPMDIFGTPSINPSEYEYIEKYRDLDDHGREMVDFVLDREHKRIVSEIEKNENNNVVQMPEHLQENAAHERMGEYSEEDRLDDENMID